MKFSRFKPCTLYELENETSHVWGIYKSLKLSSNCIFKIIKFYNDGETSLHKHEVSELLLVELGTVLIEFGKTTNSLKKIEVNPNQLIIIPENLWHRTSCKKIISDTHPYCLAVEFTYGKINNGNYFIERSESAKKSPFIISL
jgi:mannose-6-phosphate isomerase-like protein (cupin superfamily)